MAGTLAGRSAEPRQTESGAARLAPHALHLSEVGDVSRVPRVALRPPDGGLRSTRGYNMPPPPGLKTWAKAPEGNTVKEFVSRIYRRFATIVIEAG